MNSKAADEESSTKCTREAWLGTLAVYLPSCNAPSCDQLSVSVFSRFPCFPVILLVSLWNIISGKKLSPFDLKGRWASGLFTPLSAGARACQKVIYTPCASSDRLNTELTVMVMLRPVEALLLNFSWIRVTPMLPSEAWEHLI